MQRKTPYVLGILSLVFGGLLTLFELLGTVVGMLMMGPMTKMSSELMKGAPSNGPNAEAQRMFDALPKIMEAVKPWVLTLGLLVTLVGVGLIVIGVGLVR